MSEHDGDPAGDPVGSVSDEAAKLFGALSEWARDSGAGAAGTGLGTGLGQTLSGLAGHAAGAASGLGAHLDTGLDTGAPECTVCPVCRTVHVIRSTSPEVKAHLATAASSLLQAVAGLLAPPPPPSGAPTKPYERIDLDEDDLETEKDDA